MYCDQNIQINSQYFIYRKQTERKITQSEMEYEWFLWLLGFWSIA